MFAPVLVLCAIGFADTSSVARDLVVDLGLFAASPAALQTGRVMGASAGITWPGALSIGARARFGRAAENDPTWAVEHLELRAGLIAALSHRIGRGEIALGLGVEGLLLHEHRERLDGPRGGSVPATNGTAFGVDFAIEAAVRLFVYEHWGLALCGGPRMGVVTSTPSDSPRLGVSVALSLAYGFAL